MQDFQLPEGMRKDCDSLLQCRCSQQNFSVQYENCFEGSPKSTDAMCWKQRISPATSHGRILQSFYQAMDPSITNHYASLSPTASDLFERATKLHNLAKYDEAIAAYQEVVRLNEHFHPAWYAQGCAWETRGDEAQALACFRRAVSLAPEHGETHHNLGKVLHRLGLADEAMERFRSALVPGKGFLPRTAIATLMPGSPSATNKAILEARRSWAETHLPPVDRQKRFLRASPQARRQNIFVN